MSILDRIRAQGGDIVQDEWRFTLKPGRLTPEALAWLKTRLRWFLACCEVWPAYAEWAERAAIREVEGGMSRHDAERAAYGDVLAC